MSGISGGKALRRAVVQCVDRGYLPYALHLAWQIDALSLGRDFDLMIASPDEIVIPDGLAHLGIVTLRADPQLLQTASPGDRLPPVSYLRLFLPDLLADRYDRLLYLDCDIACEGGDLGRLLASDMAGLPLAAGRNMRQYLDRKWQVNEYRLAGLPQHRYFNTGVLLMDVAAYRQKDCLARSIKAGKTYPQARVFEDQSLVNLALHDEIGELHPFWNWCQNGEDAMLGTDLPVRLRHFNVGTKPWKDPGGIHPYRFYDSYRRFFEAMLPEALAAMTVPPPPRVPGLVRMVRRLGYHGKFRKNLAAHLAGFTDEWQIRT